MMKKIVIGICSLLLIVFFSMGVSAYFPGDFEPGKTTGSCTTTVFGTLRIPCPSTTISYDGETEKVVSVLSTIAPSPWTYRCDCVIDERGGIAIPLDTFDPFYSEVGYWSSAGDPDSFRLLRGIEDPEVVRIIRPPDIPAGDPGVCIFLNGHATGLELRVSLGSSPYGEFNFYRSMGPCDASIPPSVTDLCLDATYMGGDYDYTADYRTNAWQDNPVPPPLKYAHIPDVRSRGTVERRVSGTTRTFTDYCVGNSVREYFCVIESYSDSPLPYGNEFFLSATTTGYMTDQLLDCNRIREDGLYVGGSNTGAVCTNGRCDCQVGSAWDSGGFVCGVPCSADLNTAGKTIKGVVGASTKFEIDDEGHAYFDGTIIKSTTKIASNGGFIMKDQNGDYVAAFDKDGNLRLQTGAVVHENEANIPPGGIFIIRNNDVTRFSIFHNIFSDKWDVYSTSCIHEADNAAGGISEDK